MNPFIYLLSLFFCVSLFAQQDIRFEDYFEKATLRVDYYHTGDRNEEWITIDLLYRQPIWAGSKKHLIDHFNNGNYYLKVYNKSGDMLLYSKGFNSYFGEYKTTGPAIKGIKRTYAETALIPFPKDTILFTISLRDSLQQLEEIFRQEINPYSYSIIKEKRSSGAEVIPQQVKGDSENKVDLVVVGDGYTKEELAKFKEDLAHFSETLFAYAPYASHRDKFNIYGIYFPSSESGCNEPTHGIYKKTPLNTTFNSLGSPRYLLTEDVHALYDLASAVPCDAVVIMVNHKRYGGGGIYNFFATFTSDNYWSQFVLVHEFGHSFAGLADEYYTSSTAYEQFYPPNVEPLEPNITALLDPAHLKWKHLVAADVPLPTPWNKEEYDQTSEDYQKKRAQVNRRIAQLEREGADSSQIALAKEKAEELSRFYELK
ncbi:MAG TPA: peptidase M64, partial [Calditrichaeota bacterium]|nr:peptidase M64 [Calditrichota bacterium]